MRERILADRHHSALLRSLQILFEDRLGLELFVPVGPEWWDEGYWRFGQVYGDDRLARQFLHLDAAYRPDGDWWTTRDPQYPRHPIRCVTLDQARRAAGSWRFAVATVQDNQHGFARFADEVGAAYVYQVGNTSQQVDWGLDPLALVAAEAPIEGRGVRYRQEFDSRATFGYADPSLAVRDRVSSFVNCMPSASTWGDLQLAMARLDGMDFRVHGIDGPDGNVTPATRVGSMMKRSAWAWHDKPHGDGFGHVIHGWASVGRPLVGHASNYRGRLAEPLWQDGRTCIDLGSRGIENAIDELRRLSSDRKRHAEMCRAVRAEFDRYVDFDRDEREIRELLGIQSGER